ncbi:ABC transporter substrate-binding protein [Desulfomarina profundi]|uniref:ABC transporter substrate-binding protein n=1 Tax=Desulfomarina profundi TaxID=2772557 RepID=UPI001E5AFCA2|nr:ABC transporter substrate-binding protein [Desulfomarina profundi]
MKKSTKLLSLLLVVFISCFCYFQPAFADKKNDTLNIAFSKELETLDRYFNTAREGIVVARHVFDNLLYRDPVTYEYKGLLAKSFKWNSNTEMEIILREGVRFHNGQEMTADDVVYTLNFAANPDNKVKTQRYSSWIDHVEKTGPYGVKIILKKPFPAAFEFLSGANPIYPKDYYKKVGTKGFGMKPIGTGPYRITDVIPGKKIVMEINKEYFKDSPKGQPSIGKIVWRTLPEINTQMAELMTGGLDWIYLVPPDQAAKLAKTPGITVTPAETMRIGYLTFDAANRSGKEHGMENPFVKLKVRQAVNHAINKTSIARNLIGGQSRAVYSACFPSQFGCEQDVKKYEYDPQKAKQLLAEAGYPDGFETTLYGYRNRPFAEAMIGDLAAVGIKAKLMMMKYSALREKARAGKAQMQFLTWGSYSINDVSAITSHFFEFEADDLARDEIVRDLLIEADTSIDQAKRKELYSKALKRIAEQAYWCPMFTYVSNNCYSDSLDFTPYPDAVPRFFQARWK